MSAEAQLRELVPQWERAASGIAETLTRNAEMVRTTPGARDIMRAALPALRALREALDTMIASLDVSAPGGSA